MRLAVLQIGPLDRDVLEDILKRLGPIFPEATRTLLEDVKPIPRETYSSRRHQYNSTKILMETRDHVQDLDGDHVLGVVDVDLYVPRHNFVFGEAECPGKVGIISLCRLKPEFYGLPSDRSLFIERCAKEAVHEIGHTLGLSHCRDSSCVMFYSNSIFDTDRKRILLCKRCSEFISKHLRRG